MKPFWAAFADLRAGDVFKLVDQSTAGVYVVRGLAPLRIESVRHGHVIPSDTWEYDKRVLITKRA